MKIRNVLGVLSLAVLLAACSRSGSVANDGSGTASSGTPFTESVTCDNAQATRKNAYFGDIHVHTLYSVDAYFFNGLNGPREALRFGKGQPGVLPAGETDPYTAGRNIQLDRPLDFASTSDHSDFLGNWRLLCQVDGTLPIGINPACNAVGSYLRDNITTIVNGDQPAAFTLLTAAVSPTATTASPWQEEMQISDEENEPCTFTSFVGYEWTSQKFSQMIHRNVYFTGSNLPQDVAHVATPADLVALATGQGTSSNVNDDWRIYDYLEQNCNPATGCQTMTIPHNSNQSGGGMYLPRDPSTGLPPGRDGAPLTLADAQLRAKYDHVIEISQHKGFSECAVGLGIYETQFDPACTMELAKNVCHGNAQDPPECASLCNGNPATQPDFCRLTTAPTFSTGVCQTEGRDGTSGPAAKCVAPLDMARNILADGLAIGAGTLGVNPMRMGFLGSSDTHNGDPGDVGESNYPGHGGILDNDPRTQLGYWMCTDSSQDPSDPANCSGRYFLDRARGFNPGGLAGVWAPENTRAAVWSAMKRRETFATSGPRIRIRTLAMWTKPPDNICDQLSAGINPVDTGAVAGAVMGGSLPDNPTPAAPYVVVWAQQDPGGSQPGLPLQKLDLVKGWADASGQPHVKVFDAIAKTSAAVNPPDANCTPQTSGHPEKLCTVWRDPQFNATQNAYYYARAFEVPSCRWSTRLCTSAHVDCSKLSPANGEFSADSGMQGYEGCCQMSGAPGSFTGKNAFNTITERAWASPIWYDRKTQ